MSRVGRYARRQRLKAHNGMLAGMRGLSKILLSGACACWFVAGCRPRVIAPNQPRAVEPLPATAASTQSNLPLAPTPELGYAPLGAHGMDLIQKSKLSLDGTERVRLSRDGFVLSHRRVATFGAGFALVYKNDLPVYVSADAILDAVHRSYSNVLKWTEQQVLKPELDALLVGMHTRLVNGAATGFSRHARADVNEYLGVARALLDDKPPRALGGGNVAAMRQLFERVKAASGHGSVQLFGAQRNVDFSQFKPRGHYADGNLEGYFRATVWLGRVDLRVLDYDQSGRAELGRRQLEAMLLLRALLDPAGFARYRRIDFAVGTFVGPRDYAGPDAVDRLFAELHVATPHAALALSDAKLTHALEKTGFGMQRIASHIRRASANGKPRPRPRSFALLGQRYVADSEVLANVVADRVPGRMMPKPLDVAYAAMGNDGAKPLLADDLQNAAYAKALSSERQRIDGFGDAYWTNTLYTSWFGALRQLSPGNARGLPRVATGDAWNRRILGTQLASWAELRHDTVAYVKQSYTAAELCEFPAAYVDPYPRFFATLRDFAKNVGKLAPIATAAKKPAFAKSITGYATTLDHSLAMLQGMAERERHGQEPTKAELAFINDAVVMHSEFAGCTSVHTLNGWYPKLIFQGDPLSPEWLVADIHTQPTDAAGNEVGRILHVATALPELFVVTVDTCNGPAAYVGFSSPFYEVVTEHEKRLDDSQWAQMAPKHPQARWLAPILGTEGTELVRP